MYLLWRCEGRQRAAGRGAEAAFCGGAHRPGTVSRRRGPRWNRLELHLTAAHGGILDSGRVYHLLVDFSFHCKVGQLKFHCKVRDP